MLNKLAADIVSYRKEKGFHTGWDNMSEKLMLVVDEVSEAHDDLRAGKLEVYYEDTKNGPKPCGFAMECADALIRLLDIMGSVEVAGKPIDIEATVAEKMSFNMKRPYMHGKKF